MSRSAGWGPPSLLFVVVLGLWQAGVLHVLFGLREFQLPYPLQIAQAVGERADVLWRDAALYTAPGGPGPLHGAPAEEVGLLLRWLTKPGVRLVRTALPWAEPAHGAGGWAGWLERVATAEALEKAG